MKKDILTFCLVFGALSLVVVKPLWADIFFEQELSFGRFAISDNASVHRLTIAPTGATTHDVAIKPILDGRQAVIRVTDFPPFSPVSISIPDTTLTRNNSGVGNSFTISNFTFSPDNLISDANGEVVFELGATIATSGNGQMYTDDDYAGEMSVTVNY